MTLGPGAKVGPYRLERLLGRGGMAVVYEATHETASRTVALKLVSPEVSDPDFAERFRVEGRMQAALDHPHIVTVYEAGTSEYGPYLAMRLVRGHTLADLIDRGALTSARTLTLLEQVADALDAAHDAGLVHRDVKPRNVLVEDDDRAYLADFGLTRHSDAIAATAPGHFMATIAYAAPEVVAGESAGPAADRYALAAVLFECLTGSTVFPRPTAGAVLYAHALEPPPRVSGRREGIPRALDEAVIAGLAKHPADRPARAADLIGGARAALRGIELGPPAPRSHEPPDDGTTAGQVTLPVPGRAAPAPRTRRALAVAVLAGALAGGGAAVVALGGDAQPSAEPEAALPAAPDGTQQIGPDLAQPGRPTGCDGRPAGPRSPNCTVFQDRGTDTTLVIPRDGVVRRWGVRSARGELALTVLRRDGDAYFQIARSPTEFVDGEDPHFWTTDLAVEAGDRLGVVLVEGSGIGVRPTDAATTGRWQPALGGLGSPPQRGFAGELLLQADYTPGGRPREPLQLNGGRAVSAPEGDLLLRRLARYDGGARAELRIVMVRGQGRLDLLRGGRRLARIDIPGLTEPIDPFSLRLIPVTTEGTARNIGIDVRWTQLSSSRLRFHYFVAYGRKFEFVN